MLLSKLPWLNDFVSGFCGYLPFLMTGQLRRMDDQSPWYRIGVAMAVPLVTAIITSIATAYVSGKVMEEKLNWIITDYSKSVARVEGRVDAMESKMDRNYDEFNKWRLETLQRQGAK